MIAPTWDETHKNIDISDFDVNAMVFVLRVS